jgi:hypothetical protein
MVSRRAIIVILAAAMALVAYQGAFAAQETTVTLTFEKDQFFIDQLAGFDRIQLKDGSLLSRPGEPALPALQIRIAIPSGPRASIRPVWMAVRPHPSSSPIPRSMVQTISILRSRPSLPVRPTWPASRWPW